MPEEDVAFVLEQKYGVPYVDLANFRVDPDVLQMFPEPFLRTNRICPLFRSGNTLAVAMVDPGGIFVIELSKNVVT